MRKEVTSAVEFITNLLKAARRDMSATQLDTFQHNLCVLLFNHYQNHWFPEKPCKGSGYRCIRINHKMDPLVTKAGRECGIAESDLFHLLPSELTLWVDPDEVSYRIGEDGSIGVIFGENSDFCEFQDSYSSSSSEASSSDTGNLEEFPSIHGSCGEEYRHAMNPSPATSYMPTNWEYMTAGYVAS
jgi:protein Tob/BTG